MIYRWEDCSLDVPGRRLTRAEDPVHLEPQAFDVLVFLVQERHRVVAKAEILDVVWGDQFVSESALTTRIKQVRKSLGDDGRAQKFIRNVHGHGYQFVGELSTAPPSATSQTEGHTTPSRLDRPVDIAVDIAVDDEFPFVGREQEFAQIDALLRSGRVANGKAFIGGAPGSGKSRLAIEILRAAAEQGTTVCAGRCEQTVTSSLQPVRDAVAQLAAGHSAELPRWSRGLEGQLLSLIPSLVGQLDGDSVPVDGYAGIDVFLTLFERVAADRPLIILIDDLQWSDEPTRSFLARLHRRLAGQHVATLATFRSARSDLPAEVHSWIQGECRSSPSQRMELENLDDDGALALIAAVTGDPVTSGSRELVASTGGHSLFLTETLRDLQLGQDPAQSMGDLIRRRLERQTPEVQQVIESAAVLGPEFSFSVAAAGADLPLDQALTAVDAAIDAELLHETASPSRFRFSHQLVTEAIVAGLPRSRKALLHHRCANALRDENADDVEVAFHLLAAVPLVPLDDAIDQSRAAVATARAANQFDRAHRLLEAILDTRPQTRVRCEVMLEIGQILNQQGTPARALAPLEQVTEIARQNGWPDLFVAATLAHWNQSPFRKPRDTSTSKLLAEADQLLGGEPSVDRARVIAKTAVFNSFRQPRATRVEQIDAAMVMADLVGTSDAERLELLEWCHITHSCPAGSAELDALDVELERLRAASDSYFTDAAAPETSALMHGRGAELRRITLADGDRLKAQPIAEWRDLTTRSMFATFDGDIVAARDLCERAADIGDAFWGESSHALHGFCQFLLDLVSDEWTHSAPLLELLAAFGGAAIFDGALLTARHATGAFDEAEQLRERLDLSVLESMGEHILGGNGLVGFAEAAIRLDDDELAAAVESALRPFEDLVLGVPWACSLAAADPLARLARRRGDHEAVSRYTEKAMDLYDSLEAPCLAARLAR
ncbi:MAG: AAA family ATPase [Ilumatobacteraceae bacterium]